MTLGNSTQLAFTYIKVLPLSRNYLANHGAASISVMGRPEFGSIWPPRHCRRRLATRRSRSSGRRRCRWGRPGGHPAGDIGVVWEMGRPMRHLRRLILTLTSFFLQSSCLWWCHVVPCVEIMRQCFWMNSFSEGQIFLLESEKFREACIKLTV